MAYPLILLILIGGLISYFAPNSKRLFKSYLINISVLLVYNTIAWTYIVTYLDAGGVSLAPGLIMIFLTGIHLVTLLIYIIWNYKLKDSRR